MLTTHPIRIHIVSPRRSRRNSVRESLEARGLYQFSESRSTDRLVHDAKIARAQVVLLIQPEMHELLSEYLALPDASARVPVIAIGRQGSRPVSNKLTVAGLAAFLPFQELDQLPQMITRLLAGPAQVSGGSGIKLSTDSLRISQKLISMGRLSAEIAHEINNPLESVGNLLYLVQSEPNLTEKAADYLRSAEKELARVVQISKQTLSFHRESDRPASICVADLMEEVVELYGRRIDAKKLDLVREYRTAKSIRALPGEIRQVLSNLVTNAIEASASGGKLRLRICNAQSTHAKNPVRGLRITVADTGTGIPEAARKRLGELFFTTKGLSGTGLGLSVTRSIVKRYGGTMLLKSRTGRQHGTVFHIFLPLEQPAPLHYEAKLVNGPPVDQRSEINSRRASVSQISDHPAHSDNLVTRCAPGDPAAGSGDDFDNLPEKRRG